MTVFLKGSVILQFYEWCEKYNIKDRHKDFISSFMMNYSAALHNNKPELKGRFLQMQNEIFPEYPVLIEPEKLDYQEFDKIVHNVLGNDINSAELLYSFHEQELCAPLADKLLASGTTENAHKYHKLTIQK